MTSTYQKDGKGEPEISTVLKAEFQIIDLKVCVGIQRQMG